MAVVADGSAICDMDGVTEDTYGGEHPWSCWQPSLVRAYVKSAPGVVPAWLLMDLCAEHAEAADVYDAEVDLMLAVQR